MTVQGVTFTVLALLLASCGGGGAGGDCLGSGTCDRGTSPAPRLALFSTPQAISGSQVTAGYTVIQACPTCALQSAIDVFGPTDVGGTATASELDIGAYLSLDADDFVFEYGLYDLYESTETVNTGTTVGGVPVYNTIEIGASVLRAGEAGAAYDYTSYAYWDHSTSLTASFPPTIGYTSFGIQPGDIPTADSASYSGVWEADLLSGAPDAISAAYRAHMSGTASLTASFTAKTLTGSLAVDPSSVSGGAALPNFSIGNIDIDAGFAGGSIVGLASTSIDINGTPTSMEGHMSGQFYGPAAAEVGGVFEMGTESGSLNMMGGFAAKK
jgi:hypothetical protein